MCGRLAALGALVVVLVLAVAPSAWAHATVVSTAPGDGQVLPSAPATVSVRYDEPVEMQFGALRVLSPTGARVDDGNPVHPPGHSDTVQVGLKGGLGHGTYTVAWHVISADSHPVSGAFTFSIGAPSATSVSAATLNAAGSRAVGVAYGIARAVAFAGFALLVGAVAFVVCCWPAGAASRRVRVLIASGWGGLTAASLAVLGLQGPYAAGFGLGRVWDLSVLRTTLGTRLGTAVSMRLVLLGAAALGLAVLLPRLAAASRPMRIAAGTVTGALAVALAATWTAADHAGAGTQVPVAFPSDLAHLTAMAVWTGGLAVLTTALLRPAVTGAGELAVGVRRFSTIAAICVTVLVVTGTYQAWRQVGTLAALTGTAYGKLLLVKLLGVGMLVALGYLARVWIAHYLPAAPRTAKPGSGAGRPAGPDEVALRQLRRSVGLEVTVAATVLAVTAALVNAQPARTAYYAPVSATAAFDTGGPNGKGSVQIYVDPARPGSDAVHIEVVAPDGSPEQVAQLTAGLSLTAQQLGPLPVTLAAAGVGHFIGTATIPLAGAWTLAVTVRTDPVDETTVTIPVTVR
ncbi:MAG TPA: copper resistance protein CopC [Jatrophihabitans sp.]|nr:copper resistance protein CopC [Jatrophihabitans sp.]